MSAIDSPRASHRARWEQRRAETSTPPRVYLIDAVGRVAFGYVVTDDVLIAAATNADPHDRHREHLEHLAPRQAAGIVRERRDALRDLLAVAR